MRQLHWLLYCLNFILLASVSSQTAEEASRAIFFARQQQEALKLIQDGEVLSQTRDRYSRTANSGNGGYVSQSNHRQKGKEMVVKGRRLLAKANLGLGESTGRKQEMTRFLEEDAQFESWEAADGRHVEAALYTHSLDSVTLVRRDGLVFTLKKHQLADQHQALFNPKKQDAQPHLASFENNSDESSSVIEGTGAASSASIEVAVPSEADLPSINECVEQLVSDLSANLDGEEITAIGVTRFYINGSSLNDRSPSYLNRILEVLLNEGEFDVFDRSTLSVVMSENKLQYLLSGESDTSLAAGEAIVVGNLLYTKNCSEAFVVIRAIGTNDSKVLFARTARARISSDEMKELNLAYRDITAESLPRIQEESKQKLSRSLERAKSKATEFSVVFDTPQTEDLPLWGRIGYFKTLELASSLEMVLFDRDLLLTLFEEAGLSSHADQILSFGDALISIKLDESGTDQAAATIKIYNRSNSALLAIAKLTFTEESDERIEKPWNDSFAATLQHMKKKTELGANDLKYEASFKLEGYNDRQMQRVLKQLEQNDDTDYYTFATLTDPGDGDVSYRPNIDPLGKTAKN